MNADNNSNDFNIFIMFTIHIYDKLVILLKYAFTEIHILE